MPCTDVLKRKSGVIVGDDVRHLFEYAQEHGFAIPAINVTSSSTALAALGAAKECKAPVILQVSHGGSAFFANGATVADKNQQSVFGAIAAAQFIREIAPKFGVPVVLHSDHCAKKILSWLDGMLDADEEYFQKHGEPLFSSHMIDLSEEDHASNIATTKKYFERAAKMNQWLEMEIGITGGEEDGVDNSGVDSSRLYTQPEDIYQVYQALSPVSPNFSIAAAFGNVHGVYKPGNVKLRPELLGGHQEYVAKQVNNGKKFPVFLVQHGGSGSEDAAFHTAISHGVVKVNLDTDLQYAYLSGVRDYILKNQDRLMSTFGNPQGTDDKPNKKFFDPRVWVKEGEKTMTAKLSDFYRIFKATNQV